MNCNLCPQNCNADRAVTRGGCKSFENATVCRIGLHAWEEPCICGGKGSGTVFFGGCNLNCRFCQNYAISRTGKGVAVTARQLADIFVYLEDSGACNVNLVTPQHFSAVIAEALTLAKPRLSVPVVYNTNSYEKVDALRRLEGLVDIYLPDLKFCSPELSQAMCGAADYFETATLAIAEMKRQQPKDVFNPDGIMQNGVIIRYLALPSFVEDGKAILDWIASFDKNSVVSLMSQYFPIRCDKVFPQLNRRVTPREYDCLTEYFFNVGLSKGYMQDISSATQDYVPDFDLEQVKDIIKNIANNSRYAEK
ncbi:MAG: radical SAM protein [Corallococcus sp.]|nr:radical SAM protein [Corallococcus sp.]